jgi:lipid-A-disaccharide synthase-like uncharacterized protein
MNNVLFHFQLFGHACVLTPWKLVGYAGALMFAGRWFVQLAASHRAGRPHMPKLFWYMSLLGSLLLLAYFIFGKNDSVGVLSNLFPSAVAAYNLFLELRHERRSRVE